MKTLRAVLACAALELGVVDDIRELMHQMNQPKFAHVLPSEENPGEDQDRDRLASELEP